ncbi:MAG: archaemetzincin family Zn-dependent metalloprotease [Bryobacteraceae bacterium]|nr:archaemetzincin family Zn-dependent metalloprotease [Bryobacteraceae bacterium]
MESLRLIPVGDGVPLALLDQVAAALARRLGWSCHVVTHAVDAGFAWDLKRNQYYSTALLKHLADSPGKERVLGIAACDLYVPVLTFVFGEAQLSGRAALASYHRLRQDYYGLPPDEAVLLDRLVKECVHELGHTLGLRHCSDWQCVMASSHGVERVDVKSADFCRECERAAGFR